MLRRSVPRVLGLGLMLVFALNLLLILYAKGILQKLALGDIQERLHLPPSEWNRTAMERLSRLEMDLQHLSKFMHSTNLEGMGVCVCVCRDTLEEGAWR